MYEYDTENGGYFSKTLQFFKQVEWIYKFPMTEVLTKQVLNSIPEEWLEVFESLSNDELNDLVTQRTLQSHWPKSLTSFLENCQKTGILPKRDTTISLTLPNEFSKGLSPKKQHEIIHLAQLVHQKCSEKNISVVIDLGAGLGYISQLLHFLFNYRILALEANPENVESAKNRQQKLYPNSQDFVKYFRCDVTYYSIQTIQHLLTETFPDAQEICLLGLHACGDLSVDVLKLFSAMLRAKILILLPCCYHKLAALTKDYTDRVYFKNFPFSDTFQQVERKKKHDIGTFLTRPFMRLACQEPSDRWVGMSEKTHDQHAFHVLARGILELFAAENNLKLVKLVQKGTRKSQCTDFDTYLKDSMQRYNFTSQDQSTIPSAETIEEKTKLLWTENHFMLKKVEFYTALQMLLQNSAESLVLQDRICWLKENGFFSEIVHVTDKKFSPRCYAIFSIKH